MFNFNNSDIGNIDSIITEKFFNEDNNLIKVKVNDKLMLNLCKYKNDLPLIIDEVKSSLNMISTNYNIVTIDNVKYLAYRYLNDIPIKEYLQHNNIKNTTTLREFQNFIAFNYLMCISSINEDKFQVYPMYNNYNIIDTKFEFNIKIKCINELDFKRDINEVKISNRILKDYFDNSMENFQSITYKIIRSINIEDFRSYLQKIVSKYNSDYLTWVNAVYANILNAKQFGDNK